MNNTSAGIPHLTSPDLKSKPVVWLNDLAWLNILEVIFVVQQTLLKINVCSLWLGREQ